jgi:ABC-type sugar transport system permease subunit
MVDNKQQWKAWVYLLPAIILLLVFTVWPIINTLRMAFLENYSAQAEVGGAVFNFGIGTSLRL